MVSDPYRTGESMNFKCSMSRQGLDSQDEVVPMERRQLAFGEFAAVAAEVSGLQATGYQPIGKWNLGQVCDHLSYFIEGSLDGHRFKVPWPVRVLFGRMVLRRIL